MLASRLVTLRQGVMAASVTAGSNFFASHITISSFMTEGESGTLWVQFASATNAVLEFILDSGTASVIMSVAPIGVLSTVTGTGMVYNYIFPVMGDDAVNRSPSVSGTVTIFQAWLVERV